MASDLNIKDKSSNIFFFTPFVVGFNYFVPHLLIQTLCSYDVANFDPLGINSNLSSALNSSWENLVSLFSQTFESASSTNKEKPNSSRGVAGFILDFII